MNHRHLSRLQPCSLGLGLRLGLSGGGLFNPMILFANGEQGGIWLPSPATCYTDTAMTTLASVGEAVAAVADLSPNANHKKQSTSASRPILRQSGSLYYLEYDGVDDFLVTNAIDFSASDKIAVFAGVRKLSDAGSGTFAELTASTDANNGAFVLFLPSSAAANNARFGSKGTTKQEASAAFASPITGVLTGIGNIAGDTSTIRINGVQGGTTGGDQGTGNYSNAALYFGRRGGSSLPFNGREYGSIIRLGAITDALRNQAEAWLNGKTGAY